jgi:hypothetical protein
MKWYINFEGGASVEAETQDEAIDKFLDGFCKEINYYELEAEPADH